LALIALAACGEEKAAEPTPAPAGLTVRGAWARAADSGAMTAVYFTLANDGATSDTLTGVSSADAAVTEMHISTQRDGMMHMSPVTALPVPALDSVSFRPLGAHVMLTGVIRPLAEGDSVTATLSFVSGTTLTVRAGVRKP
jgi:copper(I)-binding protein